VIDRPRIARVCRAPCSRGRSRRRGGAWGMRLELQAGGGRGALGDYSTNVRRRRVIKTTAKTPNRSGGARGPVDEWGVAPRYRALNYLEHSCQCDKKKDRFRARHRAHRSRRRARRSPTSSFVMLQPRAEIRHKGIAEITSRLRKKDLRRCRYATLIQIRGRSRTKDSTERRFGFECCASSTSF
jgi:hypothetical protein